MTTESPKLGYLELLEQSAEVLEQEADRLRKAHTYRGRWSGEHAVAKEAHDEMKMLAKGLRRAHKYAKPNPFGGPAAIFDACANQIRAGESLKSAMDDFDLRFKSKAGRKD